MPDDDGTMTGIYVLPTEENKPPRAVLFEQPSTAALEQALELAPDGADILVGVQGELATWSRDVGTWMVGDLPLPGELAEAITDHAKELGVEWD